MPSESCLCQEAVLGRVDGPERRLGVAFWLVREWLFRSAGVQGLPATLDERVVPWLPSRTSFSAGGVGEELAVDRVADPSLQRAQRFLACLPLALFTEAIRAPERVVRYLGDRSDVDRVVQLRGSRAGSSGAHAWSGGRFDRGGAVVAGVVTCGRETSHIAAVADEIRGDDWSDAEHLGNRR